MRCFVEVTNTFQETSMPQVLVLILSVLFSSFLAHQTIAVEGKAGIHSDVRVQGSVLEPRKLEPSETEIRRRIKLPTGFAFSVFARDLVNPRIMAVSDAGHVYVSRRSENDVVLLKDEDGDGAGEKKLAVATRPGLHGIAITGSTMYLVANKDLYRGDIQNDGTLGELTKLVRDLPDAGQHRNRTIGVGLDEMLYVSVGSTCNECEESNPENATMLRLSPDGQMRTIYASGLRNTIGLAWHPATRELFGMDHGTTRADQLDTLDRSHPSATHRTTITSRYSPSTQCLTSSRAHHVRSC
jgi:glucose/arabinose dehydrogenase